MERFATAYREVMIGEDDGTGWDGPMDFFEPGKDNFYIYCWLETSYSSGSQLVVLRPLEGGIDVVTGGPRRLEKCCDLNLKTWGVCGQKMYLKGVRGEEKVENHYLAEFLRETEEQEGTIYGLDD